MLCDLFESSWSHRQVAVTINPTIAIKMTYPSTPIHIFLFVLWGNTDLLLHWNSIDFRTFHHEGSIKAITIVSCYNERFDFLDNLKEFLYRGPLIFHIEDLNLSCELWFWRIFKFLYILCHYTPIHDQKSLSIYQIGNHHDLINTRIWKFQGHLSCFYIIS